MSQADFTEDYYRYQAMKSLVKLHLQSWQMPLSAEEIYDLCNQYHPGFRFSYAAWRITITSLVKEGEIMSVVTPSPFHYTLKSNN